MSTAPMAATPEARREHFKQMTMRQRIIAIVSASSGNFVEWFDFYIYSSFVLYFAPVFFPANDQTGQLLRGAGIFAVGFLTRPIGAWWLGRWADRHGRRQAMLLAVSLMGLGSLLIAVLPGYAQIGIAAPILLLLARCLQGFSLGGEYGVSVTYLSEVATENRRGFYGSFQYVTLIGGQLAAVFLVVILSFFLTESQMRTWGWRLAFLVGTTVALAALFLRRRLQESLTQHSAQAGTMKALFKNKRAVFTVIGFTAGGSLSYYTFTTYMQKYLVNTVGIQPHQANVIMMIAILICILLHPLFGALSDRIGRRTGLLLFFGSAAIAAYPILSSLRTQTHLGSIFMLVMAGLTILAVYTSINGIAKAELFPTEVRALGVGLAYAIANSVFGGSAEYVALYLKSIGHEAIFFAYVSLMCTLGFIVVLTIKQRRATQS